MPKDNFINVSINSKEINNLLNKITQKTTNLRRIMSPIGNYIAKSVRQNFNEQGRPDKWQSLSPVTLSKMIRKTDYKKKGGLKKSATNRINKRNSRILINTGALMGGIHYEYDNNSATVKTTNLPYAHIHHFGGKAGKGKKVTIPARPYMLLQKQDEDVVKIMLSHFLKEISKTS